MKRRLNPGVVSLILFAAGMAVCAGEVVYKAANVASPSAVDGAALFNRQCAQCHGRDGRAKTKRGRQTHTRDITTAEWQDDVSDERIFNSISRGKGKMPAFKKLSDSNIDALVAYVRRLRK